MADTIYRISLWRFGTFPIREFEVTNRTAKTVVVKAYHNDQRKSDGYCENRHKLESGDYIFYDTRERAELAVENLSANRMAYYRAKAEEMCERLQEVCRHRAITSPARGAVCVRCNFQVPNPEDYCDGG